MMYKTSNPDHRPSAGVLMDLIRKHGAKSSEVAAYVDRYADDPIFMKKASMLIQVGSAVDSLKMREPEDKK